MSDSFQAHVKELVQQRHNELKGDIADMLAVLTSENADSKRSAAKKVHGSAQRLMDAIPQGRIPGWLPALHSTAAGYASGKSNAGPRLAVALADNVLLMKSHRWGFDDHSDSGGINFDELYDRHLSDSALPQLFDRLIALLQKLIESNEIDSARILRALDQLMQTLKRGRNGSRAAQLWTFQFAKRAFRNVMWAYLTDNSYTGPAIKGFKEAVEEELKVGDAEIARLQSAISQEEIQRLTSAVPKIDWKPLALSASSDLDPRPPGAGVQISET